MKTNEIYTSFLSHKSTLKDTSLDDSDKENQKHMTELLLEAVDFDLVKEEYAKSRIISEPCSCDALLLDKNNELNFIEFKNIASKRNFKTSEIAEKVYCTLLMFSDKTTHTVTDIAQHTNLIIVYNSSIDAKKENKSPKAIQPSASYTMIAQATSKEAKAPIIRFGFDSFKSFCFKEVYTLNQEEFEKHIESISRKEEN